VFALDWSRRSAHPFPGVLLDQAAAGELTPVEAFDGEPRLFVPKLRETPVEAIDQAASGSTVPVCLSVAPSFSLFSHCS
jgi:hypothetical protein